MANVSGSWSNIGAQLSVFPLPVLKKRAPLTTDINYPVCQLWLDTEMNDLYMLVNKNLGTDVATWQYISIGIGVLSTLTDDMGTVVAGLANNIDTLGGDLINTVGNNPGIMTFNLDRGDDGQVIIAATGLASEYGDFISTNSSITITPDVTTPGSYTIDLEAGPTVPLSFLADDANSAIPALNVLTVSGAGGLNTTAAGSTLTVNLDATVATQYTPSEGTSPVILTGNNLNLTAGANMRTIGSADTVTFALVADVDTTSYSTLAGSPTEGWELNANQLFAVGSDINVDLDITPAGTGNVNILSGTLTTASPIEVPSGGTGNNTFTAYSVICAGTTATGAFQNVSGLGTAGQVLTSNGAAALPTWQAGGGGGGGITWNEETGTSANMVVNNGYVTNNVGLVTLTLPDIAAFGSRIEVLGKGAGGWAIAQNASESIIWNSSSATTTGVGGSLASTDQYDYVELLCTVADTTWTVMASKGNITVT